MADAARAREDYTHPEKNLKNLIFLPEGMTEEMYESTVPKGLIIHGGHGHDPKEELCWSCGWTTYNQWFAAYASRVRIFHTRGSVGIWGVGSRWMIKDQPNDSSIGNDYVTQEFLRNHQPKLDIPLLKEMRILSEPTDKVRLTLMSRAQGVPLDEIWDTITHDERLNYINQLRHAMKQWRQLKSPVAQTVDGRLLDDFIVGVCEHRFRPPMCKKIGRTNEEWFSNLEKELRIGLAFDNEDDEEDNENRSVIDTQFLKLKKNFPKSEPYVLTHGDLNLTNIMVKDGKIEAILDWEWSGYMPWWAERWMMRQRLWDEEFMHLFWEDEDLMGDPDMDCGMDNGAFYEMIRKHLTPTIVAYSGCEHNKLVHHTNDEAQWLRPAFCKCQPHAGKMRVFDVGAQVEHIVKED